MDEFEANLRLKLQKITVEIHRINELTSIAKENTIKSKIITTAISDQIKMGSAAQKMALFYLIDSIMKTAGKSYHSLLEERVLKLFPPTYQSVSLQERNLFKKLIKSWKLNPTGYLFPASTLRKLEESMDAIDSPPKPQPQVQQEINTQTVLSLLSKALANSQQKPQDPTVNQEIQVLKGLYAYVSTGTVEKKGLEEIYGKINGMLASASSSVASSGTMLSGTNTSASMISGSNTSTSMVSGPTGVMHNSLMNTRVLNTNPINPIIPLNPLMANQPGIAAMMIPQTQFTPQYPLQNFTITPSLLQSLNPLANRSVPQMSTDIPNLKLTPSDIDTIHPGLYFHLYEAIDLQCKQCGLRFSQGLDGPEAKGILDAHLDWHFRMKKRMRDKAKKTICRDWYVPASDWIIEQPIEIVNDQVAPVFFREEEVKQEIVYNIPAEGQSQCGVCKEVMEKYFDEDEDIWMLKGAIKVDGEVYHQGCFGDRDSVESSPMLAKRGLDGEEGDLKRVKLE